MVYSVKEHTVINMYHTADSVSSNEVNKHRSEEMIDELLTNNGYSNRVRQNIKRNARTRKRKLRQKKTQGNNNNNNNVTTLKVPCLSDKCTAQIKRAAQALKIPIRVVATPGKNLRDVLTSSRPLDGVKCPHNNCRTCQALGDRGKCTDRNVIYEVKCGMPTCQASNIGSYNGETYRPISDRFTEHFRSANNPTAKSYKDMPLAKHYNTSHSDRETPKLELGILERAYSTTDRKIKEARTILNNKPDLNNRDEQIELKKYLV